MHPRVRFTFQIVEPGNGAERFFPGRRLKWLGLQGVGHFGVLFYERFEPGDGDRIGGQQGRVFQRSQRQRRQSGHRLLEQRLDQGRRVCDQVLDLFVVPHGVEC